MWEGRDGFLSNEGTTRLGSTRRVHGETSFPAIERDHHVPRLA